MINAHADLVAAGSVPASESSWVWDEFVQLTIALTDAKTGTYGVVTLHPLSWQIPFFQRGGDLLASDYEDIAFGLELLYDLLYVFGSHIPLQRNIPFWPPTDFPNRHAALAIGSPSLVRINVANTEDWISLPLPSPTPSEIPHSLGHLRHFLAIATTSQQPLEAWRVLQWLASVEGADALRRAGGIIPVFSHPETIAEAIRMYGRIAEGFFVEPFIVIQDFRDYQKPHFAAS